MSSDINADTSCNGSLGLVMRSRAGVLATPRADGDSAKSRHAAEGTPCRFDVRQAAHAPPGRGNCEVRKRSHSPSVISLRWPMST